jgi:hypothetical protein
MLWLNVSSNNNDYVQLKVAVDKEFVTEFAKLIKESDVMSLNGEYNWTDEFLKMLASLCYQLSIKQVKNLISR